MTFGALFVSRLFRNCFLVLSYFPPCCPWFHLLENKRDLPTSLADTTSLPLQTHRCGRSDSLCRNQFVSSAASRRFSDATVRVRARTRRHRCSRPNKRAAP